MNPLKFDWIPFLNEWMDKLDLDIDYPIQIHIRGKNHEQYNLIRRSFVKWHEGYNGFVVIIKETDNKKKINFEKRILIHELGHLYLWKLYKGLWLVKDDKSKYTGCRNPILDIFNDYHLSKFEGYYTLLLEELFRPGITFILKKLENKEINLTDREFSYTVYIKTYGIYKLVVRPEDYKKNIPHIIRLLKKGRKDLLRKGITPITIKKIERLLDQFPNIKDKLDDKLISHFIKKADQIYLQN